MPVVLERFHIFECALVCNTNTLFRKFRSWNDIQLSGGPAWGGFAVTVYVYGKSIEKSGSERVLTRTNDVGALPKTVVCTNKHRRTHERSTILRIAVNNIQNSMPICQDCGANFPLLKETHVCNKCRMLEGKSSVEKIVIKASCQLVPCQVGI